MGIKHCGKSTQGKLLASHYEVPFFDTDNVIQNITGKSPRQIYTQSGAKIFMEKEALACKNTLEYSNKSVIATGGGVCCNQAALDTFYMQGLKVFLHVSFDTSVNRIIEEIIYDENKNMTGLPAYIAKEKPHTIAQVKDIYAQFFEARNKLYQSLCDIEILLKDITPLDNSRSIIQAVDAII